MIEKGRILAVDDSKTILAFVCQVLIPAGYVVQTSTDMWISSIVSDFKPHLLLVDVEIGTIQSGVTVIQALRKQRCGEGMKMVLYSSLPDVELARLSGLCSADGWLRKDGSPQSLLRIVGTHVKSQGVGH